MNVVKLRLISFLIVILILIMAMGIITETAHPVRFQVEQTSDPKTSWETANGASVQSTTDKRQYSALANAANPATLFRTKAFPREQPRTR